ncbi:LysR family transcriptional regulator [Vibrio owensii]|uniref:LysR family transcriptional regulator n=1 Tax=Vibrio owensii TaxID=696485 RepID=UPI002895F322|nr:Bacterial regulatory helix-turn-helix, lysR family protein [Vibrio owensii]
MHISYEQVTAFVAVAECGSFSAAAKQLNKHRTTLGQVITNLEIEINMTLFDRSTRYPQLTEEGLALYQHAKNLAETTKSFERLCQSTEQGNESQITICHSELVPGKLIQDVMIGIRKKFPLVKVNWLHKNNHETKALFEQDAADLAVMLVPTGNATTAFSYTYLLNLPFVVCATSEFIKQHQIVDLTSLKRARQLLMADFHHTGIAQTLTISNLAQQIESVNVLKNLLVAGDGWAIVPTHCVEDLLTTQQLQAIEIDELHAVLQFPINLWQHNRLAGPVTREMIRLFKEHSHVHTIPSED